jgi:hypothetical protein
MQSGTAFGNQFPIKYDRLFILFSIEAQERSSIQAHSSIVSTSNYYRVARVESFTAKLLFLSALAFTRLPLECHNLSASRHPKMGLSDEEINNIRLASVIVSVFSFVGSSFICICWLRYLHLRRFAFTLYVPRSISKTGCFNYFNLQCCHLVIQ